MRASEFVNAHSAWLGGSADKPFGHKYTLYRANMEDAYLWLADLRKCDLGFADLRRVNMSDANLNGANLICANLRDADLSGASFYRARLGGADFSRSNLSNANLGGSDLSNAKLRYASLWGATLGGANFENTDLAYASMPLGWECFSFSGLGSERCLVNVFYNQDLVFASCFNGTMAEFREWSLDEGGMYYADLIDWITTNLRGKNGV